MQTPTLMAVLAHPDDESLGVGGTLAKYAAEGVDVFLLTATRGDGGRYRGHRQDRSSSIRGRWRWQVSARRSCAPRPRCWVFAKCHCSTTTTSTSTERTQREAIAEIVGHLRRIRPDVVVTFGPDGATGIPITSRSRNSPPRRSSPPRIARSTCGSAQPERPPHSVSKLYYLAWPRIDVGGLSGRLQRTASRRSTASNGRRPPWPDWAITTVIDTRNFWSTVWRAISCHESQVAAYERLKDLSPEHHRGAVGLAVVLPRLQHRERRPRTRDRSLRRDSPVTQGTGKRGIEVDATRQSPLAMDAATFRALGHRLVDQIAEFLESLPRGPVTQRRIAVGGARGARPHGPLPESGTDPGPLLEQTAQLLFDHSLFNAHPRFFGYITAPPAPIGILGDFLAAAVNPNVGAWMLSPAATEIESQTVRWIAELIGYPGDCGGLLVSGGNMANFVCFLAARAAKAGWDVREQGVAGDSRRRLRVYGSAETHTWIQKAADLERPRHGVDPLDPDRRHAAHGRRRAAAADRSGHRRRRCAVHRRRHRRVGQHRRRRSAAGHRRALQRARRVVSRRRRLRRLRGGGARGARRFARPAPTPIRSRSIRTSGSMRRSRPDARWCAIRRRCARRSRTIRPTITSRSAPPTTSTTARRTRAASARSRCGSR